MNGCETCGANKGEQCICKRIHARQEDKALALPTPEVVHRALSARSKVLEETKQVESAPVHRRCSSALELALDVSAEEARALHRVVRAMHDGHCPKCGHLGPSAAFVVDRGVESQRHECPVCQFAVFDHEAEAALKAFQPHLDKSVAIFEQWRQGRQNACIDWAAETKPFNEPRD
jgi:hypothetical protein